jgi:hypothetical protein
VYRRRKEAKERLFYGNQTNDFIDILLRRLLRSPASFFSFLLLPFHLEIDKKRKEEKSLNLCDDDDADGVCVRALCIVGKEEARKTHDGPDRISYVYSSSNTGSVLPPVGQNSLRRIFYFPPSCLFFFFSFYFF